MIEALKRLNRRVRWNKDLRELSAKGHTTTGEAREQIDEEFKVLNEERQVEESQYWVKEALRLGVPMSVTAGQWRDAATGGAYLEKAALAQIRGDVRAEMNAGWQYWDLRIKVLAAALTGLTGLVGALIGLVAILSR